MARPKDRPRRALDTRVTAGECSRNRVLALCNPCKRILRNPPFCVARGIHSCIITYMTATTKSQQKLAKIIEIAENHDLFCTDIENYDRINPITGELFGSVERVEIWVDDEYKSHHMVAQLVDGKIELTMHWDIMMPRSQAHIGRSEISLKGIADKLAEIIQTDEDHKMFKIGRWAV
jgi:hypothetical protein